jgi:hypothetical protein
VSPWDRSRGEPRGRFYSSWQALLLKSKPSATPALLKKGLAHDPKIFRSGRRMSSVACRIRLSKYAYPSLSNYSKTLSCPFLNFPNSSFHPAARQSRSPIDTSQTVSGISTLQTEIRCLADGGTEKQVYYHAALEVSWWRVYLDRMARLQPAEPV